MKVNQRNLSLLGTRFKGYLEGKKLDEFFNTFGIKFAAGHWCAGDFLDRFATEGYMTNVRGFDSGIIAQIKRVARAGIKGIELHERIFIDENYQLVPSLLSEVRDALKHYGISATNMNTNLFTDPKWKLGGITNPDSAVRRDAVAMAVQGVQAAKELGCSSVALWPGSDGWDYNFEVNYGKILDRFIDGCIAINRAAKKAGLKFGVEAKPKEPREGNMILATTQKAMLVCQEVNKACGGKNMGVCIDYGHEQMYGYEPADNLYLAKKVGVPVVNFHVNTAKYNANDEDRCAGTGDNWRMADFCYAAVDTGYNGWFGEDQFTYRQEPTKAMALSREFFGNIMKKALLIYRDRDRLNKAQNKGDASASLDVVKKVLI
jgi:L-rhamnose isomerase